MIGCRIMFRRGLCLRLWADGSFIYLSHLCIYVSSCWVCASAFSCVALHPSASAGVCSEKHVAEIRLELAGSPEGLKELHPRILFASTDGRKAPIVLRALISMSVQAAVCRHDLAIECWRCHIARGFRKGHRTACLQSAVHHLKGTPPQCCVI